MSHLARARALRTPGTQICLQVTAELGATSAELDSLAGLVRSQLHVSLVRLLREV